MFGQTLTMSYDAAGNRTFVQDNFGTETSVYDADERLETREYAGISTTQVRIGLAYQANGELSTLSRFNALGGPVTPIGTTTYLYDAADRVTSIFQYNSSGTAILSYTYSYDHAGNVSQEVDNGTTVTYAYDSDNQLTGDGGTTESYNATGNRNSTGYSSGSDNELTSDGTWSYTYDADGNLTQKTNISTGEYWTYAYNNANEMISAIDHASGGSVLSSSAYDYDAFGNRVEQDVTISGTTTVQRYANDGWNPDTPAGPGNFKWEIYADLNGSNGLETRYLRGDKVDQLFGRIASGGTAAWLLTDHLGSVVGVTDNSGTLQDTITYDGFGNMTNQTASSWTGRYGWTGREVDSTTGLQYNRARYYNPATGQWTSEDPARFTAGDCNLYRYVHDSPTIGTDPSGTDVYFVNGSSAWDPLNALFHQEIGVDTWEKQPDGTYKKTGQKAYGTSSSSLRFYPGCWYPMLGAENVTDDGDDWVKNPTFVTKKLRTTPEQDIAFKELLDSTVGPLPTPYGLQNNCIAYTAKYYALAKKMFPQAEEWTRPQGL
jgi:RHS repeat-associated protein